MKTVLKTTSIIYLVLGILSTLLGIGVIVTMGFMGYNIGNLLDGYIPYEEELVANIDYGTAMGFLGSAIGIIIGVAFLFEGIWGTCIGIFGIKGAKGRKGALVAGFIFVIISLISSIIMTIVSGGGDLFLVWPVIKYVLNVLFLIGGINLMNEVQEEEKLLKEYGSNEKG